VWTGLPSSFHGTSILSEAGCRSGARKTSFISVKTFEAVRRCGRAISLISTDGMPR
jgi:hypothetical protein